MPFIRQILLFACCFTATAVELSAQDGARKFVVPEDQAQASFPAAPRSDSKRQLHKVAEGFSSKLGLEALRESEPSPKQASSFVQASHLQSQNGADDQTPPIASASMGRAPDSSKIVPAAVSASDVVSNPLNSPKPSKSLELAEPKRLETKPTTQTSAEEPDSNKEENTDGGSGIPAKLSEKPSLLNVPISLSKPNDNKGKLAKPAMSGAAPLFSVFVSLAVVLAAFFLLVLLLRKASPKGTRLLPKELFENLGRVPLTPKQNLHLLRLGNRLILVSVSLDGVQTITEITEPDEVVQLLGLCRRQDPNSSTQLFKNVLKEVSDESVDDEFAAPKPRTANKSRAKTASSIDLYSEPDESLAEMLANGFRGGRNG